MSKLFVYGTLLSDEVLTLILGRGCVKRTAYLYDYQRVSVADEMYPAIRPKIGSEVEGALLSDLDETDMAVLDRYEGEFYQRQPVIVHLPERGSCQCMTYVFKPRYYSLLTKNLWSHKKFRGKYLQDFIAMLREGED